MFQRFSFPLPAKLSRGQHWQLGGIVLSAQLPPTPGLNLVAVALEFFPPPPKLQLFQLISQQEGALELLHLGSTKGQEQAGSLSHAELAETPGGLGRGGEWTYGCCCCPPPAPLPTATVAEDRGEGREVPRAGGMARWDFYLIYGLKKHPYCCS